MVGHVSPEAALGGPIARVRDGDAIVDRRDDAPIDVDAICPRGARRHGAARPRGVLGKYVATVSSASEGAVTTEVMR